MNQAGQTGTPGPRRRKGAGFALAVAAGLGGVALAVAIGLMVRDYQMQSRLLTTEPGVLETSPDLIDYAASLARPAYAAHCASCHGADMHGDVSRGAPNLVDKVWLYDNGGIGDVERTILYGVRSGVAKSRNITDMPAIGRTLQLSPAEVSDVETYVLSLTRPEADTAAIQRGGVIFQTKGSCYDCHSSDARGNPDYGAPDLSDNEWLYGGDAKSVYSSIYDGRHGLCPAWIDTLKPAVIRALAVYIHQASHAAPSAKGPAHG